MLLLLAMYGGSIGWNRLIDPPVTKPTWVQVGFLYPSNSEKASTSCFPQNEELSFKPHFHTDHPSASSTPPTTSLTNSRPGVSIPGDFEPPFRWCNTANPAWWIPLFLPTGTEQYDILELLHRRRRKSSTIFCSQYDSNGWYNQLGWDDPDMMWPLVKCYFPFLAPGSFNAWKGLIDSKSVVRHLTILIYVDWLPQANGPPTALSV